MTSEYDVIIILIVKAIFCTVKLLLTSVHHAHSVLFLGFASASLFMLLIFIKSGVALEKSR